jgi:hypothetical protein
MALMRSTANGRTWSVPTMPASGTGIWLQVRREDRVRPDGQREVSLRLVPRPSPQRRERQA